MMRYPWIAVVLMLACGMVVGESQKVTHYIKKDAKIDKQSHRIDLFELSSPDKSSVSQQPVALFFAKKTGDEVKDPTKRFFFAVLINQQSEKKCALYPDEGYSSAEDINSKTEPIARKWGVDNLLSIPLNKIDDKSGVMEGEWGGRPSSFKNQTLVMNSLWEQEKCSHIQWANMDDILSGEKKNPESGDSEKGVAPADVSGTSFPPDMSSDAKLDDQLSKLKGQLSNKSAEIEMLKKSLDKSKSEVQNKKNNVIDLKKRVAELKGKNTLHVKDLPELSKELQLKLWVIVAIILSFIIAYVFFSWVIAQAAKRIESGTKEILYRFGITDSTLHEIKTQMPIRGASTEDLSNQLKGVYEAIAEKSTAICSLNPKFQALFTQLQTSGKTARELGVETAIASSEDEQRQTLSEGESIDYSNQIDKDAWQVRQLLEEIKQSHSMIAAPVFSEAKRTNALKSHSDLALSHTPVLLNRMLQLSAHIALLFQATLEQLSQARKKSHQLNGQLAVKSEEVKAEAKRSVDYANLLTDELKEIGYLDRKAGIDREGFNNALTEFRKDNENRPEFLEYGRSLSSLRHYLSSEGVHDLPYFDAVGLSKLSNRLDNKNSLSKLFKSDDPAGNLIGQWGNTLQYIYRAILLLDTYWPNADKKLHAKLEQTRSTTDLLLRSQGIAPHTLSLLEEARVDNTTIKGTSNATIPRELESNETFRDRVKPLSDSELTYCAVALWGYDIIRDDRVAPGEPTLLVAKEPKDRWA